MKPVVNLGLIGLGTVGCGVVKILKNQKSRLERRIGAKLRLKWVCDKDASRKKHLPSDFEGFTTDAADVITDDEVDILIELIGGYEPARRIILEAISRGKHIVTANKALLAKHWDELFAAAIAKKRQIYFEAAVGGGIPVIQAVNEGLAANRILSIVGILNGTTNFILTRMSQSNLSYEEALALAQKAGFAEADPSFDVEGTDTAHKLAILASLGFGASIPLSQVYAEGLKEIAPEDIAIARERFGYAVKLLAIAKSLEGRVELRVHPALIPKGHPLASVEDEFNAIYITGDSVGETMFYGKGAGALPAASAVVSDIIFLARQVASDTADRLPYVAYDGHKTIPLRKMEDVASKYYLRFQVADEPGVLSKISGILGRNKVSIASCFQRETGRYASLVMVTHEAKEGNLNRALSLINRLSVVARKSVRIRIEEFPKG